MQPCRAIMYSLFVRFVVRFSPGYKPGAPAFHWVENPVPLNLCVLFEVAVEGFVFTTQLAHKFIDHGARIVSSVTAVAPRV